MIIATLGQYQSFSLIAYEAIRQQTAFVNKARFAGQDVTKSVRTLYVAKRLADMVFLFSCSANTYQATEEQIISIAGWLQRELMFTCDPIPQLEETYTNGVYDFDPYDFSHSGPADFN